MAKKAIIKQHPAHEEHQASSPIFPATGAKIEEFAEDLGRLLGTAKAKAERWLGQRQAVADHLAQIRDTAANLLLQLTGSGTETGKPEIVRRKPGRPAGTVRRGPGRPPQNEVAPKRTMSAEGRARIAAAQRARWAKQKAGKK
jgi:hypothetical protein